MQSEVQTLGSLAVAALLGYLAPLLLGEAFGLYILRLVYRLGHTLLSILLSDFVRADPSVPNDVNPARQSLLKLFPVICLSLIIPFS